MRGTGSLNLSDATLTGGHVRSTTTVASVGGAIYSDLGSVLNVTRVAFVGNIADRSSSSALSAAGGALAIFGHATIDACVFTANSAYSTGGAIHAFDASAPPDYMVTVANSIFAFNTSVQGIANIRTGPTVTSLGNNLADADAAGGQAVFTVTGTNADYVGTAPTYVVTSIADTYSHIDDAFALSLREAIDLANGSSASNKSIWLPAWDFALTRGGNLTTNESSLGSTISNRLAYGDLDIDGSLTIRGVRNATSVGWHPDVQETWPLGVVDRVFDLLGDYNDDSIVDSADYTIWADLNGLTGVNLPADDDEDGDVDSNDNSIRTANFGDVLTLANVSVV